MLHSYKVVSLRAGSPLSHGASDEELNDTAGRSLVKSCQESEPSLISVIFSFLLRLSEVEYHWSNSGKGEKTANLLHLMRSD